MAKGGGDAWSVKLLVDQHGKRVLFAEAGKDFIDYLFHIMTLPVGTVIRLRKNNGMVGCVRNLYRSIQNISYVCMESATNKEAQLNPKSPSCGASFPFLLPCSLPSACKTYCKCSFEGYYKHHSCCPNVADHPNVTCPKCQRVMTQQVIFLETVSMNSGASRSSWYAKEVVTYMVTDDMEVKPMSIISCITRLTRVKVNGALQEKMIAVGMNEALELLKT